MFIKKKDFEELKNRVEVLEFQRDNPSGLELRITADTPFCGYWALFYVKDGHIKKFRLSNGLWLAWGLLDDNKLLRTTPTPKGIQKNLYKFDVENEILIKIKEVEKPTTKKGGKK